MKQEIRRLAVIVKALRNDIAPFTDKEAVAIHKFENRLCEWLLVDSNFGIDCEKIEEFLAESK